MKNDQDGRSEENDDGISLISKTDLENAIVHEDLKTHLISLLDLGIWNPTIKEAAELVAVDMWFSGTIEGVNEPEDYDGDSRAPWLIAALADTIATFEARLVAAVNNGRLKASFVRRSLDEEVIPEETHINYSNFVEWLQDRGYTRSDHMKEWEYNEDTIVDLLCDEVIFLREISKKDINELISIIDLRRKARFGLIDLGKQTVKVQEVLRAKDDEIFRLKEKLALCQSEMPAKVDRPLHIRQRRTLLIIIAALCEAAKIDYTERGASQRIKDKTEQMGVAIDDGTIIKFLKEIPDALETRMK